MSKTVLITGGAGFIGSHLADELLNSGYKVRVIDSLLEQVHGSSGEKPGYLHDDVEFIKGDIRDPETVKHSLKGIHAVFHFAARVGVGQSMYEIDEYTSVNNQGTAVLLQEIIDNPVDKLVVASSMSIYGEGLYRGNDGVLVEDAERSRQQLSSGNWNPEAGEGNKLDPIPTPEWKRPALSSVYALGKYDQEKLCLITGKAYNIPTTALRFFNVYGTRQALSNPYTGVLAIFASRYLNDNSPLIFEDGLQKRDFVSVYDVARACRLALESTDADGEVFNIGSGRDYTVRDIADQMSKVLGKEYIKAEITGKCRVGDIRHCFADISKARKILGYEPQIDLESGLEELSVWLQDQVADDHMDTASSELSKRGLTIG